nr:deoxyribodipyrimidine photo-lyase [Candidatus Gracilibacteria bacterium]
MYKNGLFIFRQDLRTFDNTGLIEAIKNSENLITIFVLDKNLVEGFGGLTDKKFLFLKEALLNLDRQLQELGGKLVIFYDKPEIIIPEIIKKYDINAVFSNKSYSRYGKKRDNELELFCLQNNIDFLQFADFLLVEPEAVPARKVFTPFYKLWQKQIGNFNPSAPSSIRRGLGGGFLEIDIDSLIPGEQHPYFTIDFLKSRLENFDFSLYDDFRNDLSKDGTSRLSVYLRFGLISVRELYLKVKDLSPSFVSELAWRDFWQHIDYHFPYAKELEFQESKMHIKWKYDEYLFQKWCDGETGYPVVDAAMRQLKETNWMHGRARMIVASFLTKDLLIDWRLGEAYFKKHLLDYDENMNFGNWQWSASVGADPKPLRIFNPSLQSAKFDSDAKFIKKYIPELQSEIPAKIHNPIENNLSYARIIVNHNDAQKEARLAYKNKD